MASPSTATSSLSEPVATGSAVDKETIKQLRAALDAAHQEMKRMRREKNYELKQLEESLQSRQNIALKDLRCKLHREKQKEWEHQKEALIKKHEAETQKVTKLKEVEITKLRSDLTRCQEKIQQSNQRSLSGTARATFESERARQSREVLELREQKKQLEISVNEAREETRKKTSELLKMADAHQAEVEKVRKEWGQEVRKLLDELRSKERTVVQIQKEANLKEQQLMLVKIEKEKMAALQVPMVTKPAVSGKSLRKSSLSSMESSESIDMLSLSGDWDSDLSELQELSPQIRSQVAALENRCTTLAKENQQLLEQFNSLEGHCEVLQEENARFLEQNEQLETVQQSLEELVQELEEANTTLERELEETSQTSDDQEPGSKPVHQMAKELVALKEKEEHLTGTMEALQHACADKDRRIEVISQRLRRQRNKAHHKVVRFLLPPYSKESSATPGLRETYFGYEEDQSSLDSSEMSGCSLISSRDGTFPGDTSMEDSVFEEPSHDELMQNMQRLVREHLELERAFSLLQAQKAQQHVDEQEQAKSAEEKEKLQEKIHQLTEQVSKHEASIRKLQRQVLEAKEQNEELEFRNLEMEETNSKLVEETRNTVTFTSQLELTPGGLLQTYTQEKGFSSIDLVDLVAALEEINTRAIDLRQTDRVAILQAKTVLHVAHKTLAELKDRVEELQLAAARLETEKSEWLAASDVAKKVVEEHDKTRQQLTEAKQTIDSLKSRIAEFEKAEAVHKYTAEYNDVTEKRYRDEITTLKRQLNSSQEGRDYERDLLQHKIQQLKIAEQLVVESNLKQQSLEEELNEARSELCSQQEAASLTESEKDAHQSHKLEISLNQNMASESVQKEVESFKKKLVEYEQYQVELTETNTKLNQELEEARASQHSAELELAALREELGEDAPSIQQPKDQPLPPHRRKSSYEHLTDINKKLLAEIDKLKSDAHGHSAGDGRHMKVIDEDKVKELEVTLSDYKEQNLKYKERIATQQEEIIKLAAELQDSRQGYVTLEKRFVTLKEEHVLLQSQMDDVLYSKEAEATTKECQQHQVKIKGLEGALYVMKSKLSEIVQKETRNEQRMVEFKSQERELLQTLVEKDETISKLQHQVTSLQESQASVDTGTDDVSQWESQIAKLQVQLSEARAQLLKQTETTSQQLLQVESAKTLSSTELHEPYLRREVPTEEGETPERKIQSKDSTTDTPIPDDLEIQAKVIVNQVVNNSKSAYISQLEKEVNSIGKVKKELSISRHNEDELIQELHFKEDLLERIRLKLKKVQVKDKTIKDQCESVEALAKLYVENILQKSQKAYIKELENVLQKSSGQEAEKEQLTHILVEAEQTEQELVRELQFKDDLLEKLRLKIRKVREQAQLQAEQSQCIETKAKEIVDDVIQASKKAYITELEGQVAEVQKLTQEFSLTEASLQSQLKQKDEEIQQIHKSISTNQIPLVETQIVSEVAAQPNQAQIHLATETTSAIEDEENTSKLAAKKAAQQQAALKNKDLYIKQLESELKDVNRTLEKLKTVQDDLQKHCEAESALRIQLQGKEKECEDLRLKLDEAYDALEEAKQSQQQQEQSQPKVKKTKAGDEAVESKRRESYVKQLEGELKELTRLQEKVSGLDQELKTSKDNEAALQATLKRKDIELAELKEELEDVRLSKSELDEKNVLIKQLYKDIESLKEQLSVAKDNEEHLKYELSRRQGADGVESTTTESSSQEKPKKDLKNKAKSNADQGVIRSKDAYIHQLEAEIKVLRRLEEAHARCKQQEDEHHDRKDAHHGEVASDREELTTLEVQLHDSTVREVELLEELESKTVDLTEALKIIEDNQKEIQSLSEEINILRADLQEAKTKERRLSRDVQNKYKLLLEAKRSVEEAEEEDGAKTTPKDGHEDSNLETLLNETRKELRDADAEIDTLKHRIDELEALEASLRDEIKNSTEQWEKSQNLHQDMTVTQETNRELAGQIDLLTNELRNVHAQNDQLVYEIDEGKLRENKLSHKLGEMSREKTEKIEGLRSRLNKMEKSEKILRESISELETIEHQLKSQLKEYDPQKIARYEEEFDQLRSENSEQKQQLQELITIEKTLREQLEDNSSGLQISELEGRIQELTRREGDLMEQVYSLGIENQELQDQLDELLDREAVRQELEEAASKAGDLAEENHHLKRIILKAKLDAMGSSPDSLVHLDEDKVTEVIVPEVSQSVKAQQSDSASEKFEYEIQEKEGKIATLHHRLADAEQEIERMELELKSKHENMLALEEELLLAKNNAAGEEDIFNKDKEISQLKSQLKEKADHIMVLTKNLKEKTSSSNAEMELAELEELLRKAEQDKRELQENAKTIRLHEETIFHLKQESLDKSLTITDLEERLLHLRQKERESAQPGTRRRSEVGDEMDRYQSEISEKNSAIARRDIELAEKKETLIELEALVDQLRHEREEEADKYELDLHENYAQIETLKEQLKEAQEKAKQLQEELDVYKSKHETDSQAYKVTLQQKDQTILVLETQMKDFAKANNAERNALDKQIKQLKDELKTRAQGRADPNTDEEHNLIHEKNKMLMNKIRDLENQVKVMKAELLSKTAKEEKLLTKIGLLEEGENKLMEQLDILKEATEMRPKTPEVHQQEVIKAEKTSTLQVPQPAEHQHELLQLRQKVDILIDTEERLLDRVTESQELETKLKEQLEHEQKLKTEIITKLEEKQTEVDQLQIKVAKMEELEDIKMKYEISRSKINELEEDKQAKCERINQLEKCEAILLTKLEGLDATIQESKDSKAVLNEQLQHYQHTEASCNHQIQEYQKEIAVLQAQVASLEGQRQDLMALQQSSRVSPENVMLLQKSSAAKLEAAPPAKSHAAPSMSEPTHLRGLPREDVILHVMELEDTHKAQQTRIQELQNNLEGLRNLVEAMTVTMETDTDVNPGKHRPAYKDAEFEARVLSLVKSEVELQVKVIDLENTSKMLRKQLSESKSKLRNMEMVSQDKVQDLEDEITKMRQAENKLKNQVQFGNCNDESNLAAQVDHLERQVLDLEKANRKLRKRVMTLEDTEHDLRHQLDSSRHESEKFTSEHERETYLKLLSELRMLQVRDTAMQEKLTQMEQNEVQGLLGRIAHLERSEKGLKRQVELLEEHGASFSAPSLGAMMDSPEAVLRQQIRQLEKLERHQRQQLSELEHDRQELHEITRKDKDLIHDLNVRIRELTSTETHLKEQVNRYEVQESQLQFRMDDLNARLEELEATLTRTRLSEKQARAQLQRLQAEESDMNSRVQSTVEDLQASESKYKRRISDIEKEKRELMDKLDEMSERIGDLEGIEISLKQKLKNVEGSEVSLRSRIAELEEAESTAKLRAVELEASNEALSLKSTKLEEEKANLVFEANAATGAQEELERDLDEAKKKITDLEEEVEKLEQALNDYKSQKESLRGSMEELEATNKSLQLRLFELEKLHKASATKESEAENSFLHLQVSQLKQDNDALTQENQQLHEKITLYNESTADRTMATLPVAELEELHQKEQLLVTMETQLKEYEEREKSLRDTLEQMKKDKTNCGHESELEELKLQLDRHNSIIQAHELLKSNYEEVKGQLQKLQESVKQTASTETVKSTTSKSIQARIGDVFTIRQITPELKAAVQMLGSRYPVAYDEFVRTLHPGTSTMATPAGFPPGDSRQEHSPEELPMTSDLHGWLHGKPKPSENEDPLWQKVEGKRRPNEETYWANIERTSGDLDEMSLSLTFHDELDSASDSGHDYRSSTPEGRLYLAPHNTNLKQSSASPSNDSLFLPSHHGDDGALSADEASEIFEFDGHTTPSMLRIPRAKSADRDSDFSEMTHSISPGTRRRGKSAQFSGSVDSIPDSGLSTLHLSDSEILRDRITHLERQLKAKEKELDATKEHLQQLETSQKEAVKVSHGKEIDENHNNADALHQLKQQLEKTEQELKAKNNEIDRLSKEIRQWQEDVVKLSKEKEDAENQLQDAKHHIGELQNQLKESEMKQEKLEQIEPNIIQEHRKDLQSATQEKEALEKIVVKLRGQLKDLERIDLERQQLQGQLQALQDEIKITKSNESEMTKDNARLRHQIDGLTREISDQKSREHEHDKAHSQFQDLECAKNAAENMVTPLRAKVVRLSQKCQKKDDLITKLVLAYRHHDDPADLLREAELMQSQNASEEYNRPLSPLPTATMDDSFDNGVLLAAPTHQLNTMPSAAHQSKDDQLPSLADSLIVHPPSLDSLLGNHSQNGDDLVTSDPPQMSLTPVTQLKQPLPGSKSALAHQGNGHIGPVDSYIAVKDYDPMHLRHSEQQGKELPLLEGQQVKVTGPADANGFVPVLVDGRNGLVPFSHLLPATPTQNSAPVPPRRTKRKSLPSPTEGSPEQILQMHDQLRTAHIPMQHVPTPPAPRSTTPNSLKQSGSIAHPAYSRTNPLTPRRKLVPSGSVAQGNGNMRLQMPLIRSSVIEGLQKQPQSSKLPPDAPTKFAVQRVLGRHSVLLTWSLPVMDELARSNGTTVKGYRILINSRDSQTVNSPYLTKAVVEKLSLGRPQHFSIQSLGEQGLVSATVDAVFDQSHLEPVGGSGWDREMAGDGDVSSILSSTVTDDGERRVFLAVYDYRPEEHSPNTYPGEELAFKAGDIITTYGTLRPDGFYRAKVHGIKGLAPASFMEEVALLRSHSKRSLSGNTGSALSNQLGHRS